MENIDGEIDVELVQNYLRNVLEECFILVYKTSMNYDDVRSLPISRRKWFVNRLILQIETENTPPTRNVPKPPTHIPT